MILHYFITTIPNSIHSENKDFALAIVFGKRHEYCVYVVAKIKFKMIILAITKYCKLCIVSSGFPMSIISQWEL